jgi:adenylylsulfate kinase
MSWVIWIAGSPGTGLAAAATRRLRETGVPARALALDEISAVLGRASRSEDEPHDAAARILTFAAAALADAGVAVIADVGAAGRAWRESARAAIAHFAEVELVGATERLDPTGGAPAVAPELTIDLAVTPPADAVDGVLRLARGLDAAAGRRAGAPAAGFTIWITGRPGSGKTTLASRVAEALRLRGTAVRTLDVPAVGRFLVRASRRADAEQEIVYRALAFAARLLTEVGVAVIVDATAPRRAWRETARELIPRFAEVQLVCPQETCIERERAARWQLGREWTIRPTGPAEPRAPDLALDYEESLRADLTLHTDTQDLWTAVQQVLFLVRRLESEIGPRAQSPEARRR